MRKELNESLKILELIKKVNAPSKAIIDIMPNYDWINKLFESNPFYKSENLINRLTHKEPQSKNLYEIEYNGKNEKIIIKQKPFAYSILAIISVVSNLPINTFIKKPTTHQKREFNRYKGRYLQLFRQEIIKVKPKQAKAKLLQLNFAAIVIKEKKYKGITKLNTLKTKFESCII